MRVSKLFGECLHEAPADVEIESHKLLLRAGYVRMLGTGIYSYLPLAWRSVRKIEQILREEMDRIGGQEMNMPVVHPSTPWVQSGRWDAVDQTMVRFQDRAGRDCCLAMTHEEIVGHLAASEIRSYKQLPQLVYQMQTKFRDEPRARGGLIRVREFIMKDSYSLDVDVAGMEAQYIAHYDAYFRIFARAGLPVISVASDTGMMGGKVAHEYMYLTPIGEDSLVLCDACGYSANREVAKYRAPAAVTGAPEALTKVATPGAKTIAQLAAFLGVPESQTAKAVFQVGTFTEVTEGGEASKRDRLIVAIVRGDMEANPVAIAAITGACNLRPAHVEEITAAGMSPGYASPIGLAPGAAVVVADVLIAQSSNLVCGANEDDIHYTGSNHGRDWTADHVGVIAGAYEGAACVDCGAPLRLARGVEVGNIFQLGTRYSDSMNVKFADENGKPQSVVMGSYGIGVGRLLACVAEEHRDEKGLALPISVAPYSVNLIALARKQPAKDATDALYAELQAAGIDVLYDDSKAGGGAKFAEADLRGLPLRVLVSDRSFTDGLCELKRRRGEPRMVPLADALAAVQAEIAALWAELDQAVAGVAAWKR